MLSTAATAHEATTGTATALDLQIAGLVPLSTVDMPGRLVATAFCQGCPWRCFYCHNAEILDPTVAGTVAFEELEDLLRRRRGLLDGVVFSGGEATRQAALIPAAEVVRDAGFDVGLHTGGMYPSRIKALLDAGVLNWVGFDLKADPERYSDVVGAPAAWWKIRQSLEMILATGIEYEVRMTVTPEIVDHVEPVLRAAMAVGTTNFALRQAHPPAATESGRERAWTDPEWDARFTELAERAGSIGLPEVTIRPR
ncbi:anaerobic ribonucleoside-triphosphate reductase activating protein [Kocuria sp. JC486]|uniref:anaerobic ribonucleoside-triphosphate reductase activating protein n=1 Tax=Kocuria sp. JC486 TaxID=1970736 RepID=UPI0014215228|nr:anaerobic ribonucleoside-triphosphate reductase activating protein [Kocuria sp. JC486]NHU85664.1 anaerobic ribonucleoside-triphosphate reductase activating protein [Kocuria sp. JC486]